MSAHVRRDGVDRGIAHGSITTSRSFTGQRARRSSTSCSRAIPTKMAALLPALWLVQDERGWISDDAAWPRWPRCSSSRRRT